MNVGKDLDERLNWNTIISRIIAGPRVGTPRAQPSLANDPSIPRGFPSVLEGEQPNSGPPTLLRERRTNVCQWDPLYDGLHEIPLEGGRA